MVALKTSFPAAVLALVACLSTGCAIRYHDPRTGTEHLWGFAHLKMRAAPALGDAPPVVATQTEAFGLSLNLGSGPAAAPSDSGLALGWDRRTRLLVPEDRALSLQWPGAQLFDVRIGRNPPFPAPAPPAADAVAPAPIFHP